MILYIYMPELILSDSLVGACIVGVSSGLTATGGNQIVKRIKKMKAENLPSPKQGRVFITGDKHRHFENVIKFCKKNKTTHDDVLIILGDSGINYFGDESDEKLKKRLSALNINLFCIHGNKENRASNIPTYGLRSFCEGHVYCEPRYPNIVFAKDGEVYNFGGKKFLVIGGAHSVDRSFRLEYGLPYWEDEQPSDEIKALVEKRIAEEGNSIYGVLTHTCPLKYIPYEMFLSVNSNKQKKTKSKKNKDVKTFTHDIDRSTEEWLGKIESNLTYAVWYCGHYHTDKQIDKTVMLHKEIKQLF